MRGLYAALVLVAALATSGGFLISAGDKRTPLTSAAGFGPKQGFAITYDAYTHDQRAVIRYHLRRAVSHLPTNRTSFDIAAAVNAYVFQYFRPYASTGANAAATLRQGQAICGGHQEAMEQMLYAAGIASRDAYLVGIPGTVSHAMVEVELPRKGVGLFDPTYGVIFLDKQTNRLVGIRDLLRDRRLLRRTAFRTVLKKRVKTDDSVTPISSFARDYVPVNGSVIKFARGQGWSRDWDYDYAFREADFGGAADGSPQTVRVGLRAGRTLGRMRGSSDGDTPWLNLVAGRGGTSMAWAYELGQFRPGYDVAHRYTLSNLTPGSEYRLSWSFSQARNLKLNIRSAGARERIQPVPVPARTYTAGSTPRKVEIRLTARRAREVLDLTADGSGIVQGISLKER